MSLFATVNHKNERANILTDGLQLISKWAFNWKMLSSSDPSKPAQEVLFSRKIQIQNYPTISLNSIEVERSSYQKHFGIILNEKLNFKQCIDCAISKVNKGVIKKTLTYFATEIISHNL